MERREFFTSLGAMTALWWQDDRLRDPAAAGALRNPVGEGDNDAVIRSLELTLKCTCGCNLDIFTCRTTDFTCSYSPQLHAEILTHYEQGLTPEEISQVFVEKYGEQILMAPTPVGFNLAGYLVPGLAILVAGSVLAVVLARKQRTLPTTIESPIPDDLAAPTGEDLSRLEQELSEVAD